MRAYPFKTIVFAWYLASQEKGLVVGMYFMYELVSNLHHEAWRKKMIASMASISTKPVGAHRHAHT